MKTATEKKTQWFIETNDKTLINGLTNHMISEGRPADYVLKTTEDGKDLVMLNPTSKEVDNILSNPDFLRKFSLYTATTSDGPILPISVKDALVLLGRKANTSSLKVTALLQNKAEFRYAADIVEKVRLMVDTALSKKRKKKILFVQPLEEQYEKTELGISDLKRKDRKLYTLLSRQYSILIGRPRGKKSYFGIALS